MRHNVNRQRPFAYLEHPAYRDKQNKAEKVQFSRNIKGLCPVCISPFQRIPKFGKEDPVTKVAPVLPFYPCPKCLKKGRSIAVLELPESLRPWKINISLKNPRYAGFLDRNSPFECSVCHKGFANLAVFGSLCTHKNHVPPTSFTCRFCCTLDELDKLLANNKNQNKKAKKVVEKVLTGANPIDPFDNLPLNFDFDGLADRMPGPRVLQQRQAQVPLPGGQLGGIRVGEHLLDWRDFIVDDDDNRR